MPYTGKVKLQNEVIVQIIEAIAPMEKGCAQLIIYWALFGKDELQRTEFFRTLRLTI